MTETEFAEKIKTKYPQYKDWDNSDLTQKVITKYPVYKSQVDIGSKAPTLPSIPGASTVKDIASDPGVQEGIKAVPQFFKGATNFLSGKSASQIAPPELVGGVVQKAVSSALPKPPATVKEAEERLN